MNRRPPGFYGFLRYVGRLTWHTSIHFINHHNFTRASALTYTTLLAVVPTLILIHSIAGAFGIIDTAINLLPTFNEHLQLGLPIDQLLPILSQAENIRLGQLGLVGSIGLFITFIAAMENLETNMNVTWHVKNNRNLLRKVLLAIPFLIFMGVVLGSITGLLGYLAYWMELLKDYGMGMLEQNHWNWMQSWSIFIGFHGMLWFCLYLLYRIVPYTTVEPKYAMISALTTTILVRIFIWISIAVQSLFFSRFSLFYGSLAFLPLIMLLIYCIWSLILFGNALCWRMQNWPPKSKSLRMHDNL